MAHARLVRIATPLRLTLAALLGCACVRGASAPVPVSAPPRAGAATPDTGRVEPAAPAADSAGSAHHRARVALPTRWGDTPGGVAHTGRAGEIDLQHQSVRLRFDRTRRVVAGSTTIRFAAIGETRSAVTFDAVGLRTTRVTGRTGAPLSFDQGDSLLLVRLPASLAPGRPTTITVDFESSPGARGVHVDDAPGPAWLDGSLGLVSQWLPTIADPSEGATWELLLRVPSRERALASGRLASARVVGNEVEYRWVQERAAPAHLLAVFAGEVVVLQDRWRSSSLGYWTPATHVERSWQRLGRTPRMVELFSALTGSDYVWPAYDQALIADDADAGTLVPGIAMALHVTEPAGTDSADADRSDAEVARVLAHQWFDARVTPRSWTHLWLTDGFAAFMAQQFVEREHGEGAARLARDEMRERALAADLAARRPLVHGRWLSDPAELRSVHSRDRGALVLEMLRRELGDSLFWRAVRTYAAASTARSVETDDLRRALETTTGRSVEAFFRQWVYGAGYPILDVRPAYDSASRRLRLVVTQVQPRDSLTGWFDARTDLRVVTAADTVTVPVPIRGETTEVSAVLSGAPLSLRFDPDGWLLARVRFHRPAEQLRRQLADADAAARLEALRALDAAGDSRAVPAIRAVLVHDGNWRVRMGAAVALGSLRALLVPASRDSAMAALLARVRGDTSPAVRSAALEAAARSLAEVADSVAIRDVVSMAMTWLNDPASPAERRIAAIHALAPFASPEEHAAVLRALDDASAAVRRAAVAVIASRGNAAGASVLAGRLALERDPLVRNALVEALGAPGRR